MQLKIVFILVTRLLHQPWRQWLSGLESRCCAVLDVHFDFSAAAAQNRLVGLVTGAQEVTSSKWLSSTCTDHVAEQSSVDYNSKL